LFATLTGASTFRAVDRRKWLFHLRRKRSLKQCHTASIMRRNRSSTGTGEMRRTALLFPLLAIAGLAAVLRPVPGMAQGNPDADCRQAGTQRDRQRDFDFNLGTWKTRISRLEDPLSGSTTWLTYEGISVVRKVWNGRANLLELDAGGTAGRIEGLGLRLYNPSSCQWSLNWANSAVGTMDQAVIGEFKEGRGEFFNHESFNGRSIYVRNVFSDITADSSRFEQAFSDDGGKTWETNWIMTFTRANREVEEAQ
jgi:hypothetical protein